MRWIFLVFIMLFAVIDVTAHAQDDPAPASTSSSSTLTATGVAPNDVVISIDGICDREFLVEGSTHTSSEGSKIIEGSTNGTDASSVSNNKDNQASACKTEVTRAEFEKLINTLDPKLQRSDRIRVAVRYAEGMIFAERAKDIGLDKDPKTQEAAKYAYLQFLSMAFNRYLQAQAAEVSDADVKTYYEQHPELFIQAKFLRIFVPNERKHSDVPPNPQSVEERRAADEKAMQSLATRIHAKAVAGISFESLEKEVYRFAGQTEEDAPDVDLGEVTRREAPPELQQVFDLKPGQISGVISAPKGWHIVKMISRRQIPLSEARPILQSIRLQQAIDSAKSSAQTNFNDAYFNTPHGMDPSKEGAR